MKTFQIAAVVASVTGSALAQWPSCAGSCFQSTISGVGGNWQSLCKDTGKISTLNTCLSNAGCSQSDRDTANSYISSQCGGSAASGTITAATPASAIVTPGPSGWNSDAWSAYSSYVSAHPSGWASSDYASFTSKYPLPSGSYPGFSGSGWSGPGPMGGMGGFGGFGGFGSGPGGWTLNSAGPFGGGNFGPWGSGSWCSGAFTKWWGGSACPASTWSGWTDGPWASSGWTSWTACSASVTASSVYTYTSNGQAVVTTSYGYKLANAQAASSGSGSGGVNVTPSGNFAQATGRPAIGAAALALLGAVAAL